MRVYVTSTHRVWRIHHFTTGLTLIALGILACIHDARDWRDAVRFR